MVTTTDVLREPWLQALCLTDGELTTRLDDARVAGQLLAAWDGERFCYPRFQWTADGSLRSKLRALLAVLPREADGSLGADAVLWMFAPDDALDSKSPADVFEFDPERVISLASRRLEGGDA